MSMRSLFSGEYRRAAIMGVVGAPVIVALLIVRLFADGDAAPVSTPVAPAVPAPVPLTGPLPVPAVAPVVPAPVDPALFRNPFCPQVAGPAAAGSAPATCGRPPAPAGRQVVVLVDIFEEGGVRLARMRVGESTFPNLRQGDAAAGSLRVVALSERCGEFELAGAPLSLCEGEQTFK